MPAPIKSQIKTSPMIIEEDKDEELKSEIKDLERNIPEKSEYIDTKEEYLDTRRSIIIEEEKSNALR